MSSIAASGHVFKPARNQKSSRDSGLKLLRLWVPDPRSPAFAQESHRQAMLLRGAPEEAEALAFIEQVADWRTD